MLPVEDSIPPLRAALAARGLAVLHAPPGAGKTTRVPLALLDEPWLAGRRIVMLEPRRLAARAAAAYMSRQLGEPVGGTVGHRVRLDTRVGPRTRVEVVTEGVLARMLQSDPALEHVGLVIFDEFHERSLDADLGLALTLQTRELLRDDLRLLVMSATLDVERVAALLGDAPVVSSEGRAFPVETLWRPPRAGERVEAAVARVVREALAATEGDVLAFLPGQAEIRRAAALLDGGPLPAGVQVHPLFGSLPPERQDEAIAPSAPGRRKVVLATSIAETSLTIEGVRVVVDSGLSRVPRFSVRSGMTRLETVKVSAAAAHQRRGRAGRVAPGTCYRLWAQEEELHLVPHLPPEIADADLAPLALELAEAGIADPASLRWIDPPPAAAHATARELLAELGALGADGRITRHGRRMAALGTHPRLAHMLLRGAELGQLAVACDLAALLGERDVLRAEDGPPDADLRLRLEVLRDRGALEGSGYRGGLRVDADAVRRVREQSRELRRRLGGAPAAGRDGVRGGRAEGRAGAKPASAGDVEAAGLLLMLAYPDRVAQRRPAGEGRYLLRNGRGAALGPGQPLSSEPWLVAAELDGRQPESRIFLAAPVALDDVETELGAQFETETAVAWDESAGQVRALRRERLGAIVLRERRVADPAPELVAAALVGELRRRGLGALPWTDASRALLERLRFARQLDASWPDASDAALLDTLEAWLGPHLAGVRRLDDARRVDLSAALSAMLSWEQRARLDALAPTHVTVPTGSRIRVDYSDPSAPVLAVRLQELFGLAETPRVGEGRVPLTLHLLSPAQRPVQVTRDLAGFWRSSYHDVRRDLRGRYPRHHWPEDPLAAEPTRRAKRRGE